MKVLKLTPERCTGCLRCEIACSYMQTGAYQPAKSVIRVSPFEGEPGDAELPALWRYLDRLKDEPDVRSIEKRGWRVADEGRPENPR